MGENPGQGAELLARGRRRRQRSRWASLLQVLSIRLGGFHAGPVVDRLYAAVRWACSPWAIAAAALVVGLRGADRRRATAGRSRRGCRRWASSCSRSRLPLWIAAIAGVKVLHELGHALACRHFGARPGRDGRAAAGRAPALYCDVSDAWRLPSKWRRMAVSSAGMVVELVIAAVAAIVWWHAAPGMFERRVPEPHRRLLGRHAGGQRQSAVAIRRLLPAGRWLEVPNLAERARGLVSGAWRRWILGEPATSDPLRRPAQATRAVGLRDPVEDLCALVLVGVFVLFVKLAKPHGLQNAVYTAAAVTLAGLLLGPAAGGGEAGGQSQRASAAALAAAGGHVRACSAASAPRRGAGR